MTEKFVAAKKGLMQEEVFFLHQAFGLRYGMRFSRGGLYPALCLHGRGDFLEAREVRAGQEVALYAVTLGGFLRLRVAAVHDALQALVDFLEGPVQTLGVLAHFEGGDGNAADVGGFRRAKEHVVLLP